MSVQLVLYPQDYSGYSYSTTTIINEYVGSPTFTPSTDSLSYTCHPKSP